MTKARVNITKLEIELEILIERAGAEGLSCPEVVEKALELEKAKN